MNRRAAAVVVVCGLLGALVAVSGAVVCSLSHDFDPDGRTVDGQMVFARHSEERSNAGAECPAPVLASRDIDESLADECADEPFESEDLESSDSHASDAAYVTLVALGYSSHVEDVVQGDSEPPRSAERGSTIESDFASIVIPPNGIVSMKTLHPCGEVNEDYVLVNGRRDGHSRSYHKNGGVKTEEDWDSGERSGVYTAFSESGTKTAEGRFVGGLKDGVWTTWWDDATKQSNGEWRNGRMFGRWQFWDSDGRLDSQRSGFYEEGRLASAK